MREIYIIIAILIFGALIIIHEFGHYICARIFGVGIYEFSVGMGPQIVSHKSKKTGIEYSWRLLPIGGYVRMMGEDENNDDERSVNKKPVWQRIIIMAAGAAMNIILAIIIMFVICATAKGLGSTVIAEFKPGDDGIALSEQSGLQINDKVLSVNGKRVHISQDLYYHIMHDGFKPLDITVLRDDEKVTINDVVFPTVYSEGIAFGDMDFYVFAEAKDFGSVFKHAFYQSFSTVRMIWDSLLDLIKGKYGVEQLSGPVGVTSVVSTAAKSGLSDLAYITVIISMNLGICNLLPLPALDGGRLVFQFIELIFRKPVPQKYESLIHFAGLIILLMFMAFITFKDILKLIN